MLGRSHILSSWGAKSVGQAVSRPFPRFFFVSKLSSNDFTELKDTKKNQTTVFDIDELIANSPDLVDANKHKSDEFQFGALARDPREVARAINITGPSCGRTVDVRFNNVGLAISNVYSILRTNNIRQTWNIQKRYIRPAKLQKEKHRKWWRRQFAKGFSDLMTQVSDAKRRGY